MKIIFAPITVLFSWVLRPLILETFLETFPISVYFSFQKMFQP